MVRAVYAPCILNGYLLHLGAEKIRKNMKDFLCFHFLSNLIMQQGL